MEARVFRRPPLERDGSGAAVPEPSPAGPRKIKTPPEFQGGMIP
jgi:hypothetical protein